MDILSRILAGEKLEDLSKEQNMSVGEPAPIPNVSIGEPAPVPQPTEEVQPIEAPFSGGLKKIEQLTMEQEPIAPQLESPVQQPNQSDFDYLKELDKAQKQAAQQRKMAGIIEGLTQMATGATSAASGFGKAGEINLDFLRQEADMLPKNVQAKQAALMSDPRSPASKQAQEALANAFPNINKTMINKLSAEQIEKQFPALLKMDQARIERERAEAVRAEERALDREVRREGIQANQDFKELLVSDKKEARQLGREERAERKLDKEIEGLSKRLDPVQGTINSLNKVEEVLGFNLDDYSKGKVNGKSVNIPGVSIPMLGRINPTEESRMLDDTIKSIFNRELKARSGSAVTDNELRRLEDEFSRGRWNTENEKLTGLKRYKELLKKAAKDVESGFDKQALEEYKNRGGTTSEDLKAASIPAGRKEIEVRNGKQYKWNPSVGKYQLWEQ